MALNLKDCRFLVVEDLREMRMTVQAMLESMRVGQIFDLPRCLGKLPSNLR